MSLQDWHHYFNGAAAMAGLLVLAGVVAATQLPVKAARHADTAVLVIAATGLVAFFASFVCLVLS